ncbi:hypothetical protein GCM10027285_12890 [Oleiagrimonas citrea]|uniref:DUF4328 domain-containing protein n=1 Tax=Oleiagrimonas citrea TaxID=1665687 RepID=A0A846ZKU0_9GAMM|nr:DUF4328 domain-containing protein [Oleiagrimonas citrea]NKZ38148.1 DUF4328 domain-containing protein [Oleiagrimonas citrea]
MTDYHFKDTRGLTIWTCVLAAAAIVLTLVNLCDDLYTTHLFRGVLEHDAARTMTLRTHVHALITLQTTLNGTLILLWVVNVVLFCVWLYRSACNTRALGAQGLDYSPGWTVGYFFVPIANLVLGYQCMREVWKASHAPENWSQIKNPPLLLAWWVTYIAASATSRIASTMLKGVGTDMQALLIASNIEMVGMALSMLAAGMYIRIVWRISTVQRSHYLTPPMRVDEAALPDMQPG